jgi:mRNA interferase MazF
VRRGEIWTFAGGPDYSGKPPPAIIVQDERFEPVGSVTICGLTSIEAGFALFRPIILPTDSNGLRTRCRIMVDKISTVPRSKAGKVIGRLDADDLAAMNQALLLFLGLAGPAEKLP